MAQGKNYDRQPDGAKIDFRGMNSVLPYDEMPAGKFPYAANVRRYRTGNLVGRPQQGSPLIQLDSSLGVNTVRRMNDLTPAGPPSGYVIISQQGTNLYADSILVDSSLDTKRSAIQPFRPNQSVQPWAYVANDSGMVKVRSDKTCYKTGIKEPQVPATVVFAGGGGTVVPGINAILYKYVYRSSATGAVSNSGPASTPGANAQSNQVKTNSATGAPATLFTFDSTQYEFNSNQIRTKGGVPGGVLTNYVVTHNLGLSIPDGMNVNGIQVDLNWLGQANGTGILTNVAIFYGGNVIGTVKSPGAPNTTLATDAVYGGAFDTWGATLTSAMVNDPSFGFGVQISTVVVSSTDRSFINSMGVTAYYSSQNATITPTQSLDPQVNKIDIYRFGNALENYTYVGTVPNNGSSFTDTLDDLIASANQILEFDNFEPFPSIDLPRAGTVNIDSTTSTATYVSGDQFNLRWLPGTDVVIAGVPYIADRRPASTSSWVIPGVPTATGVSYEIAQPFLAQQCMRCEWGPTDNVAFMFACGDPLRPGTLYFTKGNNPDSAPQTNSIEVTSPSEPLMNGCIVGGMSMVFSTDRAWLCYPNFFDAVSTVDGTQGTPFTTNPSITNRGLYAKKGLCTDGGSTVYFWSKDGIYKSVGGTGSTSITDEDLYNIFPHEGQDATDVTYGNTGIVLHMPDYSQPDEMELDFSEGYLYANYMDTGGTRRTLVYDPRVSGWCVDQYAARVLTHSQEEGNTKRTLMGCEDGSIREFI